MQYRQLTLRGKTLDSTVVCSCGSVMLPRPTAQVQLMHE